VPAPGAVRTVAGGGRDEFGRRVVGEDGLLEQSQLAAGLQAQFLHQGHAQPAVDAERVGLPSAAVHRAHQPGAGAPAQRLALDNRLDLGEHRAVPAALEFGLEIVLTSVPSCASL
jgi:hypothetical protein